LKALNTSNMQIDKKCCVGIGDTSDSEISIGLGSVPPITTVKQRQGSDTDTDIEKKQFGFKKSVLATTAQNFFHFLPITH
jgi:hypothetical protein